MKKQSVLQFTKRFAALAGAAVLTAVTALGGTAIAANSYTMAASGNETFTLNKYLVMDKTANVPEATFGFTLATAGVTQDLTGAVPVYVGVDADKVTWDGQASTDFAGIKIAAGAATTDVAATGNPADIQAKVGENGFSTDDKYATGTATLDFSACNFTKPGVYRYALTETDGGADGMTYDTTARYLDVYVEDATQSGANAALTLKITKYVMHTTANAGLSYDGDSTQLTYGAAFAKSVGFVNEYEAESLTIENKVAGNQGDKTKSFTYTLKITGVTANSEFALDPAAPSDLALTTSQTGSVDTGKIIADAAGKVEVQFSLKHGETLEVKGLPVGASYTVTVDKGDYKAEVVTKANQTSTEASTVTETVTSGTTPEVTFTLTKAGIIPTGVIMTVAPFAAVTLLGAAGIAGVTRKKKEDEE